ncbi:hypothetical protein H5410_009412 [Solanum commersonii]|uniref:Small ribosomal subunit protein uS2c n=1 Tax=Solanum commersonii TaxID=4109 RepID=A0A9J6AJH1_SOLCO|nr:hypothetical protein H5410_009412 [Solanum commersonii]
MFDLQWFGSCSYVQSTVEEKVTSVQLFISVQEMMEAGVHFGHGTRKWNPKMVPYISAKRKGIHITNFTRTTHFLSEACDLIFDAASRGKQFLIVGTKNKATDSVEWAAIRARCHYFNKK